MATKAKIKKEKPLLSVGIIFKNEIRCLERCLKSFQPLRKKIPMEIVMADTGSDDGSRAVAAKYADILFDFPWINDFAAARNAVLDRCSGEWYLSVDADEWLDGNVSGMIGFLRQKDAVSSNLVRIMIRNYMNKEGSIYNDFSAPRMLRMSAKPRFEGAIHELAVFPHPETQLVMLPNTLLYHDGYVMLNDGSEAGKEKLQRNLKPIREKLGKDPEDLLALMQYIESGTNEDDLLEKLRRAVVIIREKKGDDWAKLGPAILRYAVMLGETINLPEKDEIAELADRMFPKSYYIRIDANFCRCLTANDARKPEDCIRYGEAYMQAKADMDTDPQYVLDMQAGGLQRIAPFWEQYVGLALTASYLQIKEIEKARSMLATLNYDLMDEKRVEFALRVLYQLRVKTEIDTAPAVAALWESVDGDQDREKRREAFLNVGMKIVAAEPEDGELRPAYTLFLPLAGKCALGDMAAALDSEDPDALTEFLARQEDFAKLPPKVLLHALEHGADFPLPEKPLTMETFDALAANLAAAPERSRAYALDCAAADFAADWQSLDWTRAVVMAAVRGFDWKATGDGLALARAFATVERAYLPRCYTPEALDATAILPPLHRVGLCCVRAFDALDAGDPAGYVRALREGLETCPEMKPMTEFLLGEVDRLTAPPELLQLADQVKALLTKYPPDDPAVAELKASPAYQKVAHLIEA